MIRLETGEAASSCDYGSVLGMLRDAQELSTVETYLGRRAHQSMLRVGLLVTADWVPAALTVL